MAGRTGISTGVGVTLGVLAAATIGFGVAWGLAYSWYADTKQQLEQTRAESKDIITAAEQNQDAVRSLINDAKKAQGGPKSLVGFLNAQLQESMQKVTGRRQDNVAALDARLQTIEAAKNGTPLLTILANRDSEITGLKDQVARSNTDRETALANMNNEVQRVGRIESEYKATIDSLGKQVAQYQNEVEGYRDGADTYKKQLDKQLEATKADFGAREKQLQDRIAKITDENIILRNQVTTLRGERTRELLRGKDEYALVDAQVLGVDPVTRQAFISVGERQKAQIGMSFAVYPDASAIRPDDAGNYPRGKATLEVINVGPSSATCAITSEARGNPVVKGDVVANAVYDPNKVYKFVVSGNFDANRDGYATPLERNDVEALVAAWGGRVVPDLTADVDFLVVGERPVLGPQPSADAPRELFLEFIRQKRLVDTYDALTQQAQQTGVPIINENRFYTLIGKTPAPIR